MKRIFLWGLLFCSSLVVASDQTLQGAASSLLPLLETQPGNELCPASSSTDVRPLVSDTCASNGADISTDTTNSPPFRRPMGVKKKHSPTLKRCECKSFNGDSLNESNSSKEQAAQGLLKKQQELVGSISSQYSQTGNNNINQLSPKPPKATCVKPFKPGPFWTWKKVVTAGVVVGGCVAGAAYYFYPRKTTDKAASTK